MATFLDTLKEYTPKRKITRDLQLDILNELEEFNAHCFFVVTRALKNTVFSQRWRKYIPMVYLNWWIRVQNRFMKGRSKTAYDGYDLVIAFLKYLDKLTLKQLQKAYPKITDELTGHELMYVVCL